MKKYPDIRKSGIGRFPKVIAISGVRSVEAERKPSIHIGGKPFYIGYYGVDRATGKVAAERTEQADMTKIRDRTDRFAGRFGYVRISEKTDQYV
jgi:hypothetical protein